ncbi:MAG: polymorphic toxin type 33 domain-containing protein [Edaphobacter sp.]
MHDDASANKVRNFTDKQVHDNYKCWQDAACKATMLARGKAAIDAASLIPGGLRQRDTSGAQDSKLTSGEIENLKQNTGLSAEEIKTEALGTKSVGKYDLYKSGNGDIVAKPKGSSGAGETTGYTVNDLKTPQQ